MATVEVEFLGNGKVAIHLPTKGSVSTPWNESSPITPAPLPHYDKLILPMSAFFHTRIA